MKSGDLIQKLKKSGWVLVRIRGSHHIFAKEGESEPIVVPHSTKDIAVGTLHRILKQLDEKE
jgi:predicted RNA binding protein YcfA (HicA-like mRNA interferase family)